MTHLPTNSAQQQKKVQMNLTVRFTYNIFVAFFSGRPRSTVIPVQLLAKEMTDNCQSIKNRQFQFFKIRLVIHSGMNPGFK